MKEDTHLADMPTYPDTGDDPGVTPGRGSTTSTPRWVYAFGIIVIVLVLLFGILHLTGGGLGPNDHRAPIEHGVQQP